MIKRIVIFLAFSSLIFGCNRSVDQPYKWKKYINIPKADFVYQTITKENENNAFGKDVLAFYSIENESISELDIEKGKYWLTDPYFLDENTLMSMNKRGNPGLIQQTRSDLLIFTKSQNLSCGQLIGFGYPFKGKVVFFDINGLSLINSADCSIIKTYITRDELSEIGEYYFIGNFILASDETFILIPYDLNLIKVSLPEKEIYDYHKTGINPTISPDQNKVAYLAPDGIHIMNINGDEDKLVIPYLASLGEFGNFRFAEIPTANWSSDSKKIIYHKCTLPKGTFCDDINDYSIFMYDLETETETFLLQGGMNPSWGWGK